MGTGHNGGIIGADNMPDPTSAYGIWTLYEVGNHLRANRWPGSAQGAVAFTDKNGSISDASSYSFSLNCGDGGDMVVAILSDSSNGSASISSWTLGGQTITTRTGPIRDSTNTRQLMALGTASEVGAGVQAFSITMSHSMFRMMALTWRVTDVDIASPLQMPTSTNSYSLSFSAFTEGSVVVMAAGNATGAGAASFDGASNIGFDGNTQFEAQMGGASDSSGDLGGTTLALTNSGSDNRELAVGIELPPI